jgi:hypothetical protein
VAGDLDRDERVAGELRFNLQGKRESGTDVGVIGASGKLEDATAAVEPPIALTDVAEVCAALVALLRRRRSPDFLEIAEATCFVAGLSEEVGQRSGVLIEYCGQYLSSPAAIPPPFKPVLR